MKKIISVLFSFILFFTPVSAEQNAQAENTPDLNAIIADIDVYAKKLQKDWNVPGMAVCIVSGDEVVYKKSFGVKEVKKESKVDNQTIFQIASCTKAFTSALVAVLVDKGYLKWDDKVVKYLPDFRLHRKEISDQMTVEDLLSQNSSLPPYSQHMMMLFGYDKKYVIESMRYIQLTGTHGKQYSYQNNMYLLLGEVIKKATGKTWEQNIKEHIFKPLGMNSSSSDYKSYLKAKNRSIGHYYSGGVLKPISDELPYNSWPYNFAPASGINSNIDDMAKWLVFLINNENEIDTPLISAENFKKLFEIKVFTSKDVYDKSKKNYYCLGWRCAEYTPEDIFWHAGTTDGEGAYISFLKNQKIGIVVLMNLPNGRMADSLTRKLYDKCAGNPEIDWSSLKMQEAGKKNKVRNSKTPPEIVVPHMDLKKYAGKYENILYGVAEIKLENGKLLFSAGNMKTWVVLKHFSGNSFDGAGVPGWTFKRPMFIFKVYENSNISGLTVENMTDGIDALFRKIK